MFLYDIPTVNIWKIIRYENLFFNHENRISNFACSIKMGIFRVGTYLPIMSVQCLHIIACQCHDKWYSYRRSN